MRTALLMRFGDARLGASLAVPKFASPSQPVAGEARAETAVCAIGRAMLDLGMTLFVLADGSFVQAISTRFRNLSYVG